MMGNVGGWRVRFVVLLSTVFGLFCWGSAHAAITTSGSIDPVWDSNDPWNISGTLTIGLTADGTLTISGGSRVVDVNGLIAGAAGTTASVLVTDVNSLWRNSGVVTIGSHGSGLLTISNGASATATGGALIGYSFSDGVGSVVVTDPNSLWQVSGGSGLLIGGAGQGALTISDGGSVESGKATLGSPTAGGAVVTVDGNDSTWTLTGVLAVGNDSVAKYGDLLIQNGGHVTGTSAYVGWKSGSSGTATVTGPNAVWTNSGALYVGGDTRDNHADGVLDINSPGLVKAQSATIWSQGVLKGTGTLEASTVTNHGTIRPGNSIGTLNIKGALTMEAGSVLETEVDNAGHSDKVVATGNVQIAGGTVKAVSTETITNAEHYTILQGKAVTGTFDALDISALDVGGQLALVDLSYQATAVVLDVVPTTFDGAVVAQTGNQREVGSALQHMADAGGNTITAAVSQLHATADVRDAYDQLSGQTRVPLSSVAAAGAEQHTMMVSNRLHRAAGAFSGSGMFDESTGMLAMAGPQAGIETVSDFGAASPMLFALGNGTPYLSDQPWGVWGKGYGQHGNRNTVDGVPGYTYNTYGATFGLDYRFTDRFLLGAVGGLSTSDIGHNQSRDSGDIEANYYGLYGSYQAAPWYFDSILSYADLNFKTQRYVDIVSERLDSDFDGSALTGYFEGGFAYRMAPDWLLQPLAGFQYTHIETDDAAESGGAGCLVFDGDRFDSYKGSLGAKEIGLLYQTADGSRATVELRGRWLHEFGDTQSTIATHFASDPGFVFTVSDARSRRDTAQLGAGFDVWFGKALRTFFDYDWEGNSDLSLNLFSAGLQYCW